MEKENELKTQQEPISVATPPTKHNSNLLPKILGVILILGIGIVIGYLFAMNTKPIKTPPANGQTQSLPITISPTKLPEALFSKLGITFKYPPNTKLLEESSNDNTPLKQHTMRFSLDGKEFLFEKISSSQENEAPYNQTSVVKDFNGTTWKVVQPSQKSTYCDTGNCSKTAPSYYVYKNGYRYSFNYYSDDLQPTIEKILSTATFTNE